MTDMNNLAEHFRELRKSSPQHAQANLQEQLLSEFRAHHRRRRRRWAYLAEAAAVLALAFGLLFVRVRNARHAEPHLPSNTVQQLDPAALSGFVPLPYAQSGIPAGQPIVLHLRMGASDLTALGVSVPPGNTREQIGADVVIGQDGVARAVRFH